VQHVKKAKKLSSMKILDFMLSQKTIFMASCNFTLNSVLKIDFYLKKNRRSFSEFFPTKCCNNNCNLMKAALIYGSGKRKRASVP
jgi:hypothetical protein